MRRKRGSVLSNYLELAKPRITLLVLVTAAAGFYLASPHSVQWLSLLHLLAGTALVAGGTNAMNQVLERAVDGRMARTRRRPLPAGRLAAPPAAAFAITLGVLGVAYLAVAVNGLTAALAAATFLIYDFLYTPLKPVHPLATLVGAVPGALPIAGGWAAARGELGPGAWALFGLLFFWQLPHFLALAWLFRRDYEAAGLKMLSVRDPDGIRTRQQAFLYTLTLLPVSLLPAFVGLTGHLYFFSAGALGVGFVIWASLFLRRPSQAAARRLFRFSLAYLPLVLGALVFDKAAPGERIAQGPERGAVSYAANEPARAPAGEPGTALDVASGGASPRFLHPVRGAVRPVSETTAEVNA
ncbi:MAG: heme o synthase [Gemmatimonadota bacterium]